eukprot:5429908-Prymnesium_polylepis.1
MAGVPPRERNQLDKCWPRLQSQVQLFTRQGGAPSRRPLAPCPPRRSAHSRSLPSRASIFE